MFKTLLKVAVAAGVIAGAVHLWRRFEVTERLVALADQVLTAVDEAASDRTEDAQSEAEAFLYRNRDMSDHVGASR